MVSDSAKDFNQDQNSRYLGIALNILQFCQDREETRSALTGKLTLSYNKAPGKEFFPEASEEHFKEIAR
jgi:hypothetical protein